MRKKLAGVFLLTFSCLAITNQCLYAQTEKGGLDAVAISKNYYNSIVKILLYDSVIAKTNPEKAYIGRGSGFFVSEDGYIFTNRHVVNMCEGYCRYTTFNPDTKKEEESVEVYSPSILTDPGITTITYAGRTSAVVQVYDDASGSSFKLYHAQILAIDTANFDGAIIKIVSDLNGNPVNVKFHPVPLGNSDSTAQGQDLCLYGFPAQYNGTFDQMLKDLSTLIFGKHSGFDFFVNAQYGFIKTDAAINSGNSGGPAFGPGNTVIGIATAAFNKTNVGLIGGVNAMYDLSALIPDLQKQLIAKGFVPPAHKPGTITTSFFRPLTLPTKKMMRRASHRPDKEGVVNNPLLFDIMGGYTLNHNGTYSIPALINSGAISSEGGNLSLKYNTDFGINFRLSKPSLFKMNNNFIGFLFNFCASITNVNFTSFPLYYDSAGSKSPLNINNATTYIYLNAGIGLSYTYLFGNRCSLGVFYTFGGITDAIPKEKIGNASQATQTVGNNNSGGDSQPGDILYSSHSGVCPAQTIGLTFRYKHLIIGANYQFIRPEDFYFNVNNGGPASVNGTLTNRSSIALLLGVAIRPKYKSS